jgi:hypothetical protein
LLAPVLAVASSDNEESPSKEKKDAQKPASSENRPAAPQISGENLRIFMQLCNKSITNASKDNLKIREITGALLDICEEKYTNYFMQNSNLTGADAFAMVGKELNTVYQRENLEGNAFLENFRQLSAQNLFQDELNRTMGVCEQRISNFIAHQTNEYCAQRVSENKPQILKICKKLFENWYHDHTNQSKWSVNERIEERLQLLMIADASDFNNIDLSGQLGNSDQSTQDIRKALVQKGQEEQAPRYLDPFSLEGCLELKEALNLSVSQTSLLQKDHIKELIAKLETSGKGAHRLNDAVCREIFWGKYSDGATLSEKDLAYNFLDAFEDVTFHRNVRNREDKWRAFLTLPAKGKILSKSEELLALARIIKYSMDPEKTIAEAMQHLQEDLGTMLGNDQKEKILGSLNQDNLHRVLLVGRLPHNLKGLGSVTRENYSEDLSIGEVTDNFSDLLGKHLMHETTGKRVDFDREGWFLMARGAEVIVTEKDRAAVQNLHKDLFYSKTLERLNEIGLINSKKREAVHALEDPEMEGSEKLTKKNKED